MYELFQHTYRHTLHTSSAVNVFAHRRTHQSIHHSRTTAALESLHNTAVESRTSKARKGVSFSPFLPLLLLKLHRKRTQCEGKTEVRHGRLRATRRHTVFPARSSRSGAACFQSARRKCRVQACCAVQQQREILSQSRVSCSVFRVQSVVRARAVFPTIPTQQRPRAGAFVCWVESTLFTRVNVQQQCIWLLRTCRSVLCCSF